MLFHGRLPSSWREGASRSRKCCATRTDPTFPCAGRADDGAPPKKMNRANRDRQDPDDNDDALSLGQGLLRDEIRGKRRQSETDAPEGGRECPQPSWDDPDEPRNERHDEVSPRRQPPQDGCRQHPGPQNHDERHPVHDAPPRPLPSHQELPAPSRRERRAATAIPYSAAFPRASTRYRSAGNLVLLIFLGSKNTSTGA